LFAGAKSRLRANESFHSPSHLVSDSHSHLDSHSDSDFDLRPPGTSVPHQPHRRRVTHGVYTIQIKSQLQIVVAPATAFVVFGRQWEGTLPNHCDFAGLLTELAKTEGSSVCGGESSLFCGRLADKAPFAVPLRPGAP